mmetsp:Transcript_7685/g.16319  ORF Transcript_7685/g.16319 Transcript_7685/m.16319 type:complete len:155 (-) Transcript_7685:171-635(-)
MVNKLAVKQVETEEELAEWFSRSRDMLLLCDLHRGWSGPCDTLAPTFEAMTIDIDNAENRVAFLAVEVPKLAPKFAELVGSDTVTPSPQYYQGAEGGEPQPVDFSKKGCSPLFVAVRSGKIVAVVEGADRPALSKVVEEYLPSVAEDEEEGPEG